MNIQGLHSTTEYYKDKNHIYDIFATAEDYPWYIYDFLKNQIFWKKVIDFGCGTWKYLRNLSPYVDHIIGIDASEDQISIAKNTTKWLHNITYIVEKKWVFNTPIGYTLCFSCRVFGTIKDVSLREKIYTNFVNSLPVWTEVYFIENDVWGEFEEIRGHEALWDNNLTKQYNQRLEQKWCKAIKHIDTFFQFTSQKQAQSIFTQIRGNEVWKKIHSATIQHKVVIYKLVV